MNKDFKKINEILAEIQAKVSEVQKLMADDVTEEVTPEAPKLTLEDVRKVLTKLSREGHTAEVKELLKKHNCNKLSEIPASEYQTLLDEAGKI